MNLEKFVESHRPDETGKTFELERSKMFSILGILTPRWQLYTVAGAGILASVSAMAAVGAVEPWLVSAAVGSSGLLGMLFNITATGASGSAGAAGAGGAAGAPPPQKTNPPDDPCKKPLSEWKSIGGPTESDLVEQTASDTLLNAIDTFFKGPAGPATLMAGGAQAAAQGGMVIHCGKDPRNRTRGQRRDMDAAMDEITGRKYDNLRK